MWFHSHQCLLMWKHFVNAAKHTFTIFQQHKIIAMATMVVQSNWSQMQVSSDNNPACLHHFKGKPMAFQSLNSNAMSLSASTFAALNALMPRYNVNALCTFPLQRKTLCTIQLPVNKKADLLNSRLQTHANRLQACAGTYQLVQTPFTKSQPFDSACSFIATTYQIIVFLFLWLKAVISKATSVDGTCQKLQMNDFHFLTHIPAAAAWWCGSVIIW